MSEDIDAEKIAEGLYLMTGVMLGSDATRRLAKASAGARKKLAERLVPEVHVDQLRRQRDALAWVVWQCWQFSNTHWEIDPVHIHEWMLQAGLVEGAEATVEDCTTFNHLEPGELMMQLTPFGKEAVSAAAETLSHG